MVTRKNIGRPTKYSDSIVREFERAFRIGMTDQRACEYIGVNPDTYYDWIKKKKGFSERVDRAKLYLRIKATQVVVHSIVKDQNVASARWWLERKYREEFSPKNEVVEANQPPPIVKIIDYSNAITSPYKIAPGLHK